jgi:hypothetical protein
MRRGRPWQFSLRTLFVLAVPLAAVLAVSRLAQGRQLWLALLVSAGYFGGCGVLGALLGRLTRRKEGVVDGALAGLLVATLLLLAITLAGR